MKSNFKTSLDFRKSLEARLHSFAKKSGQNLQRLRRKVAFDRLLARIFSQEDSNFFLKGGYAMELRTSKARTTKDIDLTSIHATQSIDGYLSEAIFQELQNLARIDLHDQFTYQIGRSDTKLENPPYGGARYPVAASIGGKRFVEFHLDVGGDILVDLTESFRGVDWLDFCGISSPMIPMISVEQQFVEKLHAYTLPHEKTQNSRVKDLIDMLLLLEMRKMETRLLQLTLDKVFLVRNTHSIPLSLEKPPSDWKNKFEALAEECGLSKDMNQAFGLVAEFYQKSIVQK